MNPNYTCVVHLTKVEGSMQASARVARFLSDQFGCMLVDDEQSLITFLSLSLGVPGYGARRYTVIFVNGPIAFCGFRDAMGTLLLPITERVFWVQQDYTITLPPNKAYSRPTNAETPFRAEFHAVPHVHLWSTCQDVLAKRQNRQVPGYEHDEYVDWNALTYAPTLPHNAQQLEDAVFYYGALRSDRRPALNRMFCGMETGNLVISASNLNKTTEAAWLDTIGDHIIRGPVKQGHLDAAKNGNSWGRQPLLDEIAAYRHSVYIADAPSNMHFHSLANRFYEVLSTPYTVLWLDAEGADTYRKAGLHNWQDYAVEDSAQLQSKIGLKNNKLLRLAEDQRASFLITDPFKALVAQVRALKKALS